MFIRRPLFISSLTSKTLSFFLFCFLMSFCWLLFYYLLHSKTETQNDHGRKEKRHVRRPSCPPLILFDSLSLFFLLHRTNPSQKTTRVFRFFLLTIPLLPPPNFSSP